jgi:hypothetical protein
MRPPVHTPRRSIRCLSEVISAARSTCEVGIASTVPLLSACESALATAASVPLPRHGRYSLLLPSLLFALRFAHSCTYSKLCEHLSAPVMQETGDSTAHTAYRPPLICLP